MKLHHPELVDLMKKAYSAEKAAAFAYQGHAAAVKNPNEKKAIRQIEIDEWNHRTEVLEIMRQYDVSISKFYEFKFHVIVKISHFILPGDWKVALCVSTFECSSSLIPWALKSMMLFYMKWESKKRSMSYISWNR